MTTEDTTERDLREQIAADISDYWDGRPKADVTVIAGDLGYIAVRRIAPEIKALRADLAAVKANAVVLPDNWLNRLQAALGIHPSLAQVLTTNQWYSILTTIESTVGSWLIGDAITAARSDTEHTERPVIGDHE